MIALSKTWICINCLRVYKTAAAPFSCPRCWLDRVNSGPTELIGVNGRILRFPGGSRRPVIASWDPPSLAMKKESTNETFSASLL